MQRNRRVFVGVLIAAVATFGVAAPTASAAARKASPTIPGAPDAVLKLSVKSNDQNAKVSWEKPTSGGTVASYRASLHNLDGTPVVDAATMTAVQVSTTAKNAKLVRPRVATVEQGISFVVRVVAIGVDGSVSPMDWRYVSLRYKK